MFNKLKQVKDLRNQAKTMQDALSNESVTLDKGGITLSMDGNMKITSLKIEDDVKKEKIEKIVPDLANDATKKIQKIMAQKMQEMGGLQGLF
ncbi:hypothetical protein C0583_02245 [Candidatus Parcubacteria bacterium]|nr:MAG: hypothetical protein C0583_02245 [Candidatus Parcubacteria bacterium]